MVNVFSRGPVTHIRVSKLTTSIVSDNGLSPGRRQAIIWTNAGILLIWPLGTNSSEILIGIRTFWFKKMRLKMSSGKWQPFCLGLNVLNTFNLLLNYMGSRRIDPSEASLRTSEIKRMSKLNGTWSNIEAPLKMPCHQWRPMAYTWATNE